jgi:hypothetical protein
METTEIGPQRTTYNHFGKGAKGEKKERHKVGALSLSVPNFAEAPPVNRMLREQLAIGVHTGLSGCMRFLSSPNVFSPSSLILHIFSWRP